MHIPGINSDAFGTIQNMRGLIPGVMNDMWDINPENLWNNMQGKGPVVKDCFADFSRKKKIKTHSSKNDTIYYLIIFFLITILCCFSIYRYY